MLQQIKLHIAAVDKNALVVFCNAGGGLRLTVADVGNMVIAVCQLNVGQKIRAAQPLLLGQGMVFPHQRHIVPMPDGFILQILVGNAL